nr:lytic transglycosylase domain-containing protein [Amylibacter sp.]
MRPLQTIGICCALILPSAVNAGGTFSMSNARYAIYEKQIEVLERRGVLKAVAKPKKMVLVQDVKVSTKGRLGGRHMDAFLAPAKDAARRHKVPENLFLRLIQQESAWNKNAKSPVGAIGLAQLMPATARELGVNPNDPHDNLEGGARYLREQFVRFGDWRLALAAYNAGPGAVNKYGGVPPYKETQNYVRKILGG